MDKSLTETYRFGSDNLHNTESVENNISVCYNTKNCEYNRVRAS